MACERPCGEGDKEAARGREDQRAKGVSQSGKCLPWRHEDLFNSQSIYERLLAWWQTFSTGETKTGGSWGLGASQPNSFGGLQTSGESCLKKPMWIASQEMDPKVGLLLPHTCSHLHTCVYLLQHTYRCITHILPILWTSPQTSWQVAPETKVERQWGELCACLERT